MLHAKYLNGTPLKIYIKEYYVNLLRFPEYIRLLISDALSCSTICLFPLSKQPVCIKDITPNLQSCERIQDIKASFRCKADVFLSLDSSDCEAD